MPNFASTDEIKSKYFRLSVARGTNFLSADMIMVVTSDNF